MAEMEMYEEWPLLEFTDVRKGILSRFSADASDSVAHLLIRELVESLDKPQPSKISNEREMEWICQIINHAFSLSFVNQRDCETIHAAVRIYLNWMTAVTINVHSACPQPLKDHPDRYFRRMLEAMRSVFVPREASEVENVGSKQAAEMKIILSSLRTLSTQIIDNFKDECWSKLILFLLAVNSQMLDDPNIIDENHSHISAELLRTLFDCWTTASLLEYIPSPSYWKTFTNLARRWLVHLPLIEEWGKNILPLGALVLQRSLKNQNYGPSILDNSKLSNFILKATQNSNELEKTWLKLFNLIGNPTKILAFDFPGHEDQLALSFFLCVLVYSKFVDIIHGDETVSMDFHESEQVLKLWAESCKEFQEEWTRSYHQQRTSNMSSGSVTTDSGINASGSSTGRKNTLISSNRQTVNRSSGRSGNLIGLKEPLSAPICLEEPHFPELPRPKLSQYVYYYLKSNPFRPLKRNQKIVNLSANKILEIFLYFLSDAALKLTQPHRIQEDAISQRSMSSVDFDSLPVSGEKVTRKSFGPSTTSSNEYSLLPHTTTSSAISGFSEFPTMDGVAAGRAAALGALCRIVCEKSSSEELSTDQLAQFYLVVHKALVERDRLSLCTILYYGTEMFKLGLKGVEILLPNYLMAIDIVLTESMKVRLHPSIQEVEMRHTCLQALSSIVAWPTVFSSVPIVDEETFVKLGHGGTNLLEQRPVYLELRQRILKNILIPTLRNESDPTNLHLALNTCAIFCLESCRHDLESLTIWKKTQNDEEEERCFAVTALKGIVSAVCDNLCKTQWTSELITSLAALDCLNVLATVPVQILFFNDEMSTGSLIIASLCRFIDVQLKKPPMHHSRDLHSSVVAAYFTLGIWLTTAPKLAEIESCLITVAEAIEFGLTGGKNLTREDFKPASLRVRDAAENLMNILMNFDENFGDIIDERKLLYKYGPQQIDTTKFKHFLLNNSTILSIHEASHISDVSEGNVSVLVVTRTPYSLPNASIFQLKPSNLHSNETASSVCSTENSPASVALNSLESAKSPIRKIGNDGRLSIDSTFEHETIKQFEFPSSFEKPLCKLDAAFDFSETSSEASKIIEQLQSIRNRFQQGGGSAFEHRDAQNVWIQSSLGTLLTQQLKPPNSAAKVNSIRNFLYDLGFIGENSFNSVLQPLDSGNAQDFYADLHQIVDRTPVRIAQTVGIFYVRDGQKTVAEILENALYLEETMPEFCELLAEIGECVQVSTHPHWTGHWATAFSNDRKPIECAQKDRYIFDGINHCLWWADHLVEVAFLMYSQRTNQLNSFLPKFEPTQSKNSMPNRGLDSVTDSAFEDDSTFQPQNDLHHLAMAHHPTWHQLHRQITYTNSMAEQNNNLKNCAECKIGDIHGNHSQHARRCLSVSTTGLLEVPNVLPQKISPRLYVKHQPLSREASFSAFEDDFAYLGSQFSDSLNFDQKIETLVKNQTPGSGTYSLSYLKNFFRRAKTPDPDEKLQTSNLSVFDGISNSKHLGSTSPNSEIISQQQSRRSDVSQNSTTSVSGSSTTASKSNQSKSTSTFSNEFGSNLTTRIGSQSTEKSLKRNLDQRIFIVWLEKIEDMLHFPYEQLFEFTGDGSFTNSRPDFIIIYLYQCESGLVRIHLDGIWTKYGQPGPLIDGAVVSITSLPSLLKQTIGSISRRRCFEIENYQTTFLKRKLAIQEFSKKYSVQQNYSDFLDSFIFT